MIIGYALFSLLMSEWMLFVGSVRNNTFPQPLSSEDETYYLQQLKKGDREARNKLIEHNLRLVAHIAKKYTVNHDSSEDLISIGTIGLIKGIDTYKPGKGTKLATYAARCIENELLMHFRSLKKVSKDISLYQPIGQDYEGNEIQLLDVIQANNIHMDEWMNKKLEWEKIQQFVHLLSERERYVISHRFGVDQSNVKTQKEIATQLRISRSYVSRIEKRALLKLFRAYQKVHVDS